jgi:PIN domain nuclease of toxin-antitoxin system
VKAEHILDASALLALLFAEPGLDVVKGLLASAAVHTFTLAEVITKVLQKGLLDPEALIASLNLNILPGLDLDEASALARLHAETRQYGLSMGDCLCLSMAAARGLIAVTADQDWVKAMQGRSIQVLCIR